MLISPTVCALNGELGSMRSCSISQHFEQRKSHPCYHGRCPTEETRKREASWIHRSIVGHAHTVLAGGLEGTAGCGGYPFLSGSSSAIPSHEAGAGTSITDERSGHFCTRFDLICGPCIYSPLFTGIWGLIVFVSSLLPRNIWSTVQWPKCRKLRFTDIILWLVCNRPRPCPRSPRCPSAYTLSQQGNESSENPDGQRARSLPYDKYAESLTVPSGSIPVRRERSTIKLPFNALGSPGHQQD